MTNSVEVRVVRHQYDGGPRALFVLLASFLCNGLVFGTINSYSVIQSAIEDRLEKRNIVNKTAEVSLVGSLTIGTTFLLSSVAGVLTDSFGLRTVTFVGGALATTGILLSSFLTENLELLCLTYGVLFGMGCALTYTPSLVVLGHHFRRFLGIANGFVAAGSSVFTVLMPFALDLGIQRYSLETTLRVLAVLTGMIMAVSPLFRAAQMDDIDVEKEVPIATPENQSVRAKLGKLINVDIWKRRRYVIWAFTLAVALFGYFVPYVHMGKLVEELFPQEKGKGKVLILCIGLTSGLGRLITGRVADLPKVNRIILQQLSFLIIGIGTMLLPIVTHFYVLIAIALVMGLCDGCFISLLGPIAFQLCGHEGASQAIGCLLGLASVPLTVGPYIAGKLRDSTGSCKLSFLLAGIPPIIGAVALFAMNLVRDSAETIEAPGIRVSELSVKDPLRAELMPVTQKVANGATISASVLTTPGDAPDHDEDASHKLLVKDTSQ